jgi:glycogen debranching enzyme
VLNSAKSPFDNYLVTIDGFPAYVAGRPGYPRNFSRDVFTAGMLALDEQLLTNQINISSKLQGTKYDKSTGEEPGKIHHEYPGVKLSNSSKLFATYNACDSTSLYLIAFETLTRLNSQLAKKLTSKYRHNIEAAVGYILHHIKDNIFYEFPPPGAARFALRATYWKDSPGPLSAVIQPITYPISYALAHFQAARSLLSASALLDRPALEDSAHMMFERGISAYSTNSNFIIGCGPALCLNQVSSDELHTLAYIPAEYANNLPLKSLVKRSRLLETSIGYACMPEQDASRLSDTYHGYVVWPFEQAMIHYGASKFELKTLAKIAQKIIPSIGAGQELFDILPEIKPRGNPRQLWSEAAAVYFNSVRLSNRLIKL